MKRPSVNKARPVVTRRVSKGPLHGNPPRKRGSLYGNPPRKQGFRPEWAGQPPQAIQPRQSLTPELPRVPLGSIQRPQFASTNSVDAVAAIFYSPAAENCAGGASVPAQEPNSAIQSNHAKEG